MILKIWVDKPVVCGIPHHGDRAGGHHEEHDRFDVPEETKNWWKSQEVKTTGKNELKKKRRREWIAPSSVEGGSRR